MHNERRGFLKWGGLFLTWLGARRVALAGRGEARLADSASDSATALARFTNGRPLRENPAIVLQAPEVAEDGAVVPVSVRADVQGTRRIALWVEQNPYPLVADCLLEPNLEPYVSLRLKLNASSEVQALVETDDGWYVARRFVRVVLGGCA